MSPLSDADLAALPLHNLRDVGGLRTDDGREVRRGRLLRGGTPAFLDADGVEALLGATGVRTRLDLRGQREVAEETSPALRQREHAVHHHELHAGGEEWQMTEAQRAQWVGEHYLSYLDASGPQLAALWAVLADPDAYPVLVHCTAGKDRTGVLVALLLATLGVPDEAVVADYARSAGVVDELRALLGALPVYRGRLAELPQESLATDPAAMRVFLAGLAERHGGATGYLRSVGVPAEQVDAVRAALLD